MRGMCTHGEVLLQRVSALLLQVEGGAGVGREAGTWAGQRWKQRVHTWTMRHNDHIDMRRKSKM